MMYAGDRILAERVARGDEDAFHEVFHANLDAVRGVLFRVAGPAHDPDDLVQTTFLEVYRSSGSYRGECPYGAWIRGVAARVALRAVRSAKRRAAHLVVVEDSNGVAEGADQHEACVTGLRLRRLRAVLERLDPDKRAVLMLHEVEGLGVREIAEALGLSVAAAKSRLLRGRAEMVRLAAEDRVLAEMLAEGSDDA